MSAIRAFNKMVGYELQVFNSDMDDDEIEEFMDMTFEDLVNMLPEEARKVPIREFVELLNACADGDEEKAISLAKKYGLNDIGD